MRAWYAHSPERETAELQHAIYPWDIDDDAMVTVLDISGTPGNLIVRDTLGGHFEVCAATAEQLVAAAAQLPSPPSAMFCWPKKVGGL